MPKSSGVINSARGEKAWAKMLEKTVIAQNNSAPFNAVLSIRYKTPDDGYRMGAYFWGNGNVQTPYPLRLDIQGAMGSSAIKIMENQNQFVLYDAENNTAYLGSSTNTAFLNLGMPLPFNLADFSMIISGRYAQFLGIAPLDLDEVPMPELIGSTGYGDSIFRIPHLDGTSQLTVNHLGVPVLIVEEKDKGWTMEFSYDPTSSLPGPEKIFVHHPDGYSISILFRSFGKVKTPFSNEQLDLILPDNLAETKEI